MLSSTLKFITACALCLTACNKDTVTITMAGTDNLSRQKDYLLQVQSEVVERTPRPSFCVRLTTQEGHLALPGTAADATDAACPTKTRCQLKANNLGKSDWLIIYRASQVAGTKDILIASLFIGDECSAVGSSGAIISDHKELSFTDPDMSPGTQNPDLAMAADLATPDNDLANPDAK